jgi:signal recognition particle GTPase
MFSQLGDKLQDIFKDLRGHGTISETNINDALRQVRLALLPAAGKPSITVVQSVYWGRTAVRCARGRVGRR